jgi:hypothetical protein
MLSDHHGRWWPRRGIRLYPRLPTLTLTPGGGMRRWFGRGPKVVPAGFWLIPICGRPYARTPAPRGAVLQAVRSHLRGCVMRSLGLREVLGTVVFVGVYGDVLTSLGVIAAYERAGL